MLRRAVRFAKQIGIDQPFMYKLVPEVAEIMVNFYPEVKEKQSFIQNVIKTEEERFHETLNDGLAILSTIMKQESEKGSNVFPGTEVFRLYDTYGFPKELTEEYVADAGFTIDEDGFMLEMEKQRERARNARQKTGSMQIQEGVLGDVRVASEFTGYDQLRTEAEIVEMIKGKEFSEQAEEGDTVYVFLIKHLSTQKAAVRLLIKAV